MIRARWAVVRCCCWAGAVLRWQLVVTVIALGWAATAGLQQGATNRLYAQARGEITLEFRERESEAPLVSRVKVLSPTGQPQRVRGALYRQGWNLFERPLSYTGRVGEYTYQCFHGPQFSSASGGFTLDVKSQAHAVVHLPRHADVALEGWVGGDLLSQVAADETLRWLAAEDLTVAAVVSDTFVPAIKSVEALLTEPQAITEPTDDTPTRSPLPVAAGSSPRWVHAESYWDARPGSGLLLHHWLPPAEVPQALPSSRLLVMSKEAQRTPEQLPVHAEIQSLGARDVPIWLASGKIDSVQVLGPHVTIDGLRAPGVEPLVEPEPGRFQGPRRAGRLVEYLYWQILECGFRLPPSAGSGFGENTSPLGYNRIYAYAPHPTPSAWWQAVRDGQSFVTNGPLLRATVNGEVPGKLFTAPAGEKLELQVALTLTVADPVEYLEVVFNGGTLYRARLDEYARAGGVIPPLTVSESGWLLIRVVTDIDNTYRLATTAPYYVEVGGRPRISAQSVSLFQAWLERAAEQIESAGLETAQAAQPYLAAARQFWEQQAAAATVP